MVKSLRKNAKKAISMLLTLLISATILLNIASHANAPAPNVYTNLPTLNAYGETGNPRQTGWYWKASYIDYAPSGVPDFDQRQDNWGKLVLGVWKWTYCGPTATANCLWWMDSRFETGITPPPSQSDNYNLLTAYGSWDDHAPTNVQPFITSLGWYMDTDGVRTGTPYNGTDAHQMEKGIAMYLRDKGLETAFAIKKMQKPNFYYVEEEIEKCEDVILLLGIWQSNDGVNWWRVGGHYVTCAGVDSDNLFISFSDPDANNAEAGGQGRVLPPGVPHPHPPRPVTPPQQDTIHNDASFVSQDTYGVMAASPSPGGTFALSYYEPQTNPSFMQNIQGQNCPSEFESKQGVWNPGAAMTAVEVEYSITISPADWYFKPGQLDFAPAGVTDFDQKQWRTPQLNWTNPWPPVGTWSWCGPVAVANSLWWLDSEYEPNPQPYMIVNDGFPLVQSYIPGLDDHVPMNVPYLVEDLAMRMDTDGMNSGVTRCGTEVHAMLQGIGSYLTSKGLDKKFYNFTVKAPDFFWVADEIKQCEDVTLLLGFWQNYGTDLVPYWVRVGGHYVTCAGVDSNNMMLAISDPFIDNAEDGWPGYFYPPGNHAHGPIPDTLHNNATYGSHDFYYVVPSVSPGGSWGLSQYPAENIIGNFQYQNFPVEFNPYEPYNPALPIHTEIEYAVVVSCKTGIVAAGCQDTNVYTWDFLGNLQWQFATGAPVLSVALDNEANYLASGSRILPDGPGVLCFYDAQAVTNGDVNMPLWAKPLNISESYDNGWMGTESKSVDVKYNIYNAQDVVAATTDQGLYLFDQLGNQIFHYWDEDPEGTVWPETIVRISQDGNFMVCASHYGPGRARGVHYFSSLRDGVPGWGPNDDIPVWDFYMTDTAGVFWVAISGLGDYVAVSGWLTRPMGSYVTLLNGTGAQIWLYSLALPGRKGGYVRVDMPCDGRSVVCVNDDPSNVLGTDLLYFSDGGNGWDSGDGTPVWSYWPGKEIGNPPGPLDDFYTVAISEDGDYISTGGLPPNTYLLNKTSSLIQTVPGTPGNAIQSTDLTFTGRYVASGDAFGVVWFFDKDNGLKWSRNTDHNASIHSIAVSKIYPCMFPFPDHDVAVTNVQPDKIVATPGDIVTINVTVHNDGNFSESFFDVFVEVLLDGMPRPDLSPSSITVLLLNSGNTTTLTFKWNTTGLSVENYTLIAKASIVYNELDVYDNTFIDGVVELTTGIHDIAVTNARTSKDGCTPMPTVSNISKCIIRVTVFNEGTFTENVTVNAYANLTIVATAKITNLAPSAQITVNLTWYTTGFAKGNYTISAYAAPESGDGDTSDNTFTDGWVLVVKPGDINGDKAVNFLDAILLGSAFGSKLGDTNWNPNSDLNEDEFINFLDAIILGSWFGQ